MVAGRGSEFNSYHIIARPLQRRREFELRLGAHVTRLIQSRFGAVEGVEYFDIASATLRTIRARAVVLAAGTVDTTRILLSSVSTASPAGLGNEHGLVGRYVHDHPRDWWPVEFERPLTLLSHPLYLARSAYSASPPLSGASATIGLAATRDLAKTWIGRKGRRFGVQVFGTMTPSEDHVIRLAADRVDRFGVPCVEIDIRYDDAARATLSSMRDRFAKVFADAGAPVRLETVDWMPRPGSSVHYAGSVRMHANPELGVLDPWNRIHSCPNVVVADMSSFTTSPEKNPTLTAMALSARAARKLADDIQTRGGTASISANLDGSFGSGEGPWND
jgi:choline dehydrogenase-like flavoprotein